MIWKERWDGGRQYCDGWIDDAAKGGFSENDQKEEEESKEEEEEKEEEVEEEEVEKEKVEKEEKEKKEEALARPNPCQAEMVTGDTEQQKLGNKISGY